VTQQESFLTAADDIFGDVGKKRLHFPCSAANMVVHAATNVNLATRSINPLTPELNCTIY
jgi:hypothetical protein